jgi:serine phosphatase RsbU (regulator of sigma subunit)
MASLVALEGPGSGKEYPLSAECVLGRSFNSDIYIGDLNVSRRHARIQLRDGTHVVEDLGSGNGTFVNERLISRHVLEPDDVIRIGGSTFRYKGQDQPRRWSEAVLTVIADASALVDSDTGKLTRTRTEPKDARREAESLENLTAERAQKMLKAMYAVADEIGSELDLGRQLDKILDHLLAVFSQAERGVVLLANPATGELVPEATKQRSTTPGKGFKFSQSLVQQVIDERAGVIRGNTLLPVEDPQPDGDHPSDPSLISAEPSSDFSSAGTPRMGVPLICGGEILGTLHLEGNPGAESFSQDDLALLSAIARQAAVAMANARAGQSLLNRQRLEDDLRLARQIQRSFLPHELPQIGGIEFDAHYRPALNVGGDFYDAIQLGHGRIGLLVGDVSGKGVSAALMMAKLTSDIRLLSQTRVSPAAVLTLANKSLIASALDAMFATVVYVLLDLERGTFTMANAGHQPPIVCSRQQGAVAELDDATAVALGVVSDITYPEEQYPLIPGQAVLLYSDGINEAVNRQGQEFGMKRLLRVIGQCPPRPRAIVRRVVADMHRFVGGAPQNDDQTIVAFGVAE